MSEKPFVSVVTPFYNTAGYLRECIESVLSQTYTNFEYLLVDNQSTDGSASIAAEYAAKDERVRVIRNPKFVGQVPNYNGALRHVDSTARYVKVVQADDCIFPECLERMIAVASNGRLSAYPGQKQAECICSRGAFCSVHLRPSCTALNWCGVDSRSTRNRHCTKTPSCVMKSW